MLKPTPDLGREIESPTFTISPTDSLYALLESFGNPRLRLVTALIQEAGLSFQQVCDLKVTSFDFVSMTIVPELLCPGVVRCSPFGTETLIAFFDWIAERVDDMEDGYYGLLLHDAIGNPLTIQALQSEFGQLVSDAGIAGVLTEERLKDLAEQDVL